MRASVLGLLSALFALTGCIMLEVAPRPAGNEAGARFATLRPLNVYGSYRNYPDKTVTSHFLSTVEIGGRFVVARGTLPAGTTIEIVDALDRTAAGLPHSRIYRVRLAPEIAGQLGLTENLVEVSDHRLIEPAKGSTPRLREEYFRPL